MNEDLKKKITKIWNGTKHFNQNTFSEEEKQFMGNIPKFIWDYFNEIPNCVCGNELSFISLPKGYKTTCKECSKKEKIKKYQKSMLDKYGYVSAFQNKEIHKKALEKASSAQSRVKAQISMIKNGTHQGTEYHKNKVNKTKLEKWGSTGFVNREKQRQTKLERYGDENYSNQEQASQTMLELYGVTRYAKTKEFKEKFSSINNHTYKHFKNIDNFNDDFIKKNFVDEYGFDLNAACEYFNCTYNTFKNKDYFFSKNKIGRKVEDDFRAIFKDTFRFNDRIIIKPLEIDMLCLDKKFGIEYNGLFWHSDEFKDSKYHLNKTELMEGNGFQLFHIFENEWLEKSDIWLSMINNKLGVSNRVYARRTTIKEVDYLEAHRFCIRNHLQGYSNSKVKIGLYYNDELVSLMTFGKSRYNKNIEWELIRYCSKLNTNVVGGASKLLKYFERKYNPKSLISYANRRWSQGNLYEKLGFTFRHNTTPNYFYFRKQELYSREQFQKHKLNNILEIFDEKETEVQNMKNNNYYRIFDSGNKVYIKEYK